MAKKYSIKESIPSKMADDYNLLKEIRADKLHKANIVRRDMVSRSIIENDCDLGNKRDAYIGQLCYFDYFEPKYQKSLEYYDSKPCSLVIAHTKTKEGEHRILCWNLHYYPPRIRYQLLSRVLDIYKPYFRKAWADGRTSNTRNWDPELLIDQLKRAKLDFGLHMYVPELIRRVRPVPVAYWHKAVFTEGRFKKRTREAIMNYWKNFKV